MAIAPKGISVRQTGSQLVFRASLKDSSGIKVTSGTTTLYVYEYQSDGTLKSYDFDDNTFKTTALTTETASMTHRTGNNSTTNTGVWTYSLGTVTGFTSGGVYLAIVSNSSATPPQQEREFQYGGDEGDLLVTAGSTGQAYLQTNLVQLAGSAPAATLLSAMYQTFENGTAQTGSGTTITLRAGASATDDFYKDQVILITGGTGAVQTNRITGYNGTTKVATVGSTWAVTVDSSSTYVVLGRVG
jgi:hypothetical protein